MAYYPVIYEFKNTLLGQYRVFGDKSQNIVVRLSSSAPKGGSSTNFTVRLQRNVAGAGYKTVGVASFPRNGLKEATFKSLRSGLYRLRFEKSTDSIVVKGAGAFESS